MIYKDYDITYNQYGWSYAEVRIYKKDRNILQRWFDRGLLFKHHISRLHGFKNAYSTQQISMMDKKEFICEICEPAISLYNKKIAADKSFK
jgi:hypothetical protein